MGKAADIVEDRVVGRPAFLAHEEQMKRMGRLELISQAGHYMLVENAETCADRIIGFLKGTGDGAPDAAREHIGRTA